VLGDHLDHELIEACAPAIARAESVELRRPIRNVHRTVGGLLSSAIARERGAAGLPPDTITVDFHGSAGQSFGAWLAPGVSFTLWGDANDYTGKGMSGGTMAVRPAPDAGFTAEDNVVVGNTVLYGATSGKAFFRGLAGERFAVRNSGVSSVVEGVGDHGCEYMTGGRVVVLGETGLNFAAGMSGGIAYVLDPKGVFPARCNTELVDLEDVDEADAIELRELIAEHRERTGSAVAAQVLDSFDELLPAFVKVFPRDYKRALAELSEADGKGDEGVDVVLPTAPAPAR
jgi:glutamate synthase domain-containing protein 3